MPIYEYKCDTCGYHFENIQKFSDPLLTVCPKCNHENLQKLISNSYFSLKGSGWHKTDYKNNTSCANTNTTCPASNECKNKTPQCAKEVQAK